MKARCGQNFDHGEIYLLDDGIKIHFPLQVYFMKENMNVTIINSRLGFDRLYSLAYYGITPTSMSERPSQLFLDWYRDGGCVVRSPLTATMQGGSEARRHCGKWCSPALLLLFSLPARLLFLYSVIRDRGADRTDRSIMIYPLDMPKNTRGGARDHKQQRFPLMHRQEKEGK